MHNPINALYVKLNVKIQYNAMLNTDMWLYIHWNRRREARRYGEDSEYSSDASSQNYFGKAHHTAYTYQPWLAGIYGMPFSAGRNAAPMNYDTGYSWDDSVPQNVDEYRTAPYQYSQPVYRTGNAQQYQGYDGRNWFA